MVMAGVIYGYVQANRIAEWSSMSQAAQSYALQGLEQVRAAKWDLWAIPIRGSCHAGADQFHYSTDIMDVPSTGAPFYVTNYIKLIRTRPRRKCARSGRNASGNSHSRGSHSPTP